MMPRVLTTLTLAAALILPASAYANPHHQPEAPPYATEETKANYAACIADRSNDPKDCLWHLKFDDCPMTDNRGPNHTVAKLRGITVSLNDCIGAVEGLAAEGRLK